MISVQNTTVQSIFNNTLFGLNALGAVEKDFNCSNFCT